MDDAQLMPADHAGYPSLTSTDVIGDLTTQGFIRDNLLAQDAGTNPPNDHYRVNVDGDSEGYDNTYGTASTNPGRAINSAAGIETVDYPVREIGHAGISAEDIAHILRRELESYDGAFVRIKVPTVTSTMRVYIPAPVSGQPAIPIQFLSVDPNRYRILIDSYGDSAGTFRLFLGQTSGDALSGTGFRMDSTQSHPLQVFWGSDLWVGADPANTVGGYFNAIVERYR